jgi:hypothetical protein
MKFHAGEELGAYRSTVAALAQAAQGMAADAEPPEVVAETIWQAATDGSPQLRYPAGETAVRMLAERASLGDEEHHARTRERFGL